MSDQAGRRRIYARDGDAAHQLQQKAQAARARHEAMVQVNAKARESAHADGRAALPCYSPAQLRRAAAAIYRVELRLKQLRAVAARPPLVERTGAYIYSEDAGANRVAFRFAQKPPSEVRDALATHGFRPSSGADWVYARRMNAPGLAAARHLRQLPVMVELLEEPVS